MVNPVESVESAGSREFRLTIQIVDRGDLKLEILYNSMCMAGGFVEGDLLPGSKIRRHKSLMSTDWTSTHLSVS